MLLVVAVAAALGVLQLRRPVLNAIDRRFFREPYDSWTILSALVLYESLAGWNPMAAASLDETLERICRARIPDVRERSPDCPAALATFLRDALSRDPRRRPSSGREMGERLRRVSVGATGPNRSRARQRGR